MFFVGTGNAVVAGLASCDRCAGGGSAKSGVVVDDGIVDLFSGQVWQIAEAVLTGVAQEVAVAASTSPVASV